MITYKISKSYYNPDWKATPGCQARYGCWIHKVKAVKVITPIKCICCKGGHKETFYMCKEHLKDLPKYLPRNTDVTLSLDDINDPVTNLFIK